MGITRLLNDIIFTLLLNIIRRILNLELVFYVNYNMSVHLPRIMMSGLRRSLLEYVLLGLVWVDARSRYTFHIAHCPLTMIAIESNLRLYFARKIRI